MTSKNEAEPRRTQRTQGSKDANLAVTFATGIVTPAHHSAARPEFVERGLFDLREKSEWAPAENSTGMTVVDVAIDLRIFAVQPVNFRIP